MCSDFNSRVVNFSQGMPEGYRVEYDPGSEMYWWTRLRDWHADGPYADRFRARRDAVADSKKST